MRINYHKFLFLLFWKLRGWTFFHVLIVLIDFRQKADHASRVVLSGEYNFSALFNVGTNNNVQTEEHI